jgi:hypothetical protein
MGLFSNRTKRIINELRHRSQYYSGDLTREINEKLRELKSDYEESGEVLYEFTSFVAELRMRLNHEDAEKLENYSRKLAKIERSARNGVDAMWEISKNQRKTTAENLGEFKALGF